MEPEDQDVQRTAHDIIDYLRERDANAGVACMACTEAMLMLYADQMGDQDIPPGVITLGLIQAVANHIGTRLPRYVEYSRRIHTAMTAAGLDPYKDQVPDEILTKINFELDGLAEQHIDKSKLN